MKMLRLGIAIAIATITLAQPAIAKVETRTLVVHNDQVGIPVVRTTFPIDLTSCSAR